MSSDDIRRRLIPNFPYHSAQEIALALPRESFYLKSHVDAWLERCEVVFNRARWNSEWIASYDDLKTHARLASPPIEIKPKSREERAIEFLKRVVKSQMIGSYMKDRIQVMNEIEQFLKEQTEGGEG